MNYIVIEVNKRFILILLSVLLFLGAIRVSYSIGYDKGLKDMALFYARQNNTYEKS